MGWTVLCVSKISPAQRTWNLILERAGYCVVSTDDPGEATRIFSDPGIDAVVFGDLSPYDRKIELARTFKGLNRAIPIIAFNKTTATQLPAGIADEQLESLGDPRLLLEALARVLPDDGFAQREMAKPQ